MTPQLAPPPATSAARTTVPLTADAAGNAAKLLLTKQEISAALNLPPRTLDRLTASGILPVLRITPKLLRFELDACLAALRKYQTATLKK